MTIETAGTPAVLQLKCIPIAESTSKLLTIDSEPEVVLLCRPLHHLGVVIVFHLRIVCNVKMRKITFLNVVGTSLISWKNIMRSLSDFAMLVLLLKSFFMAPEPTPPPL